jgi:hypothetical protein
MLLDWIAQHKWVEWVFSGVGVGAFVALWPTIQGALGAVSRKYGFGIAGTWSVRIEDSVHPGPHGRMVLNQIGRTVWGSAELTVTQNGRADRVLRYRYRGSYSREQAVLRFQEVAADDRLIGATVLKVDTRADSASGCNAFWDHSSNARRFQQFTLQKLHAV